MKKSLPLKISCVIMVLCAFFSFFICGNINKDISVFADESIEINSQSLTVNSNIYHALVDSYDDYSYDYDGRTLPSEYCMRDEYMIFGENQAQHGLCWAHTGNTTLSTTLMKATGMYYDFSEGWISTSFNYLSNDASLKAMAGVVGNYYVGGGGNFVFFDYLSQNMGVVLENDFTYGEYHDVSSEAVTDYYNFVSSYANKTLLDSIEGGNFSEYIGDTEQKTIMNSMKQHILVHGSIYAGMSWGGYLETQINNQTVYYKVPNTNSSSGHAISIIGWDDDIVIGSHVGAWIILNSWGDDSGNDGIYYVTYDDADIYEIYGYKYVENTTGLYLNSKVYSSNASYTTNLKGAYYNLFNSSSATTKQKNIFYTDDIDLTYSYTTSSDASIENVELFYFDELVTSTDLPFGGNAVLNLNESTKLLNITGTDLESGAYKVLITYSNGATTKEHINTFYVMDGTELNYANYNFNYDGSDYVSTNAGGSIYNNGSFEFFDDYNNKSNELVVGTSYARGTFIVTFQAGVYSSISSFSPILSSGYCELRTDDSNENLGLYCFNIYFNVNEYTRYPFTITTTSGKTRTLTVVLLTADSNDVMVNVMYNTNGGENSDENVNRVLVDKTNSAKIAIPTKKWHTFLGWYTDKDFSNALAKSGEYYLLPYSSVHIVTAPTLDESVQDYFDKFHIASQYAHLYAKWERIKISVVYYYNNGTANKTVSVNMGERISPPTGITKEGHTFVGWYTDSGFTTEWDFTSKVLESVSLYAKWEINKYIVTLNYNNGQTSLEYSINYGEKITRPSNITKMGYTFGGWYNDSLFSNLWNFETTVKEDVTLYAKWTLKAPSNITISSEKDVYETFTNYNLSINFSHELMGEFTYLITWYRDGEEIKQSSNAILTEKLYTKGTYAYTAKVSIVHNGNRAESYTSEEFTVVVNEKPINITNIEYFGEGSLSWDDAESGSQYVVLLFKTGKTDYIYRSEKLSTSNINVWDNVNSSGSYYIAIEKYVGEDIIGVVQSHTFDIVSLTYQTFDELVDANYPTQYVDKNYSLSKPKSPARENYMFNDWYKDDTFTNLCVFPMTISKDMTIYANYSILNLNVDEISDYESEYNKDTVYSVAPSVTHDVSGSYLYAWYKKGSDGYSVVSTNSTLSAFKVSDSGNYYLELTLVDSDGFVAIATSNIFDITISKAATQINTTELLGKTYTYNGTLQTISSGARLERSDELVTLEYLNNTFTNVPQEGYIDVIVSADETENYQRLSKTVRVTINKKQSAIQILNKYQTFVYQGRQITPDYVLDNEEQLITCSTLIKDAQKYIDVVVTANESQNYLYSSAVVTVEVTQATIIIKAKDVTSFWLFGKKDLEYEISGEYYGGEINVELLCDVDTYKPGEYTISISIDNPNYKVQSIEGTYTVTAIPYYAGIILLALVLLVIFTSRSQKMFSIDFEENGGSMVAPIETKHKNQIKLGVPHKEGYKFAGWFVDQDLLVPFDGQIKRGKDVILYAKWEKEQQQKMTKQESDIDHILKGLNITLKQNVKPAQTKPQERLKTPEKVQNVEKSQTESDKMRDIISKVSLNNTNYSQESVNELIKNITKKKD